MIEIPKLFFRGSCFIISVTGWYLDWTKILLRRSVVRRVSSVKMLMDSSQWDMGWTYEGIWTWNDAVEAVVVFGGAIIVLLLLLLFGLLSESDFSLLLLLVLVKKSPKVESVLLDWRLELDSFLISIWPFIIVEEF